MSNLIDNTDPLLESLHYSDLEVGEQAQIDALITVSSELIEKKCSRVFALTEYEEEKHNGSGENWLFLNNIPIVTITNVRILTCDADGTDYTSSVFEFNSKTGEVVWKKLSFLEDTTVDWLGYFPKGYNNILFDYQGGFADIPAPVKYLCAEMVKESFSPGSTPGSLEFEKLGQYFYKTRKDFFEKFLMSHNNIINLYKLRRVSEN